MTFEAYNYRNGWDNWAYVIRHRGMRAYVESVRIYVPYPTGQVATDRQDATFTMIPGLAGKCSSFESVNFPDHYLRHQHRRLVLSKRTDDQLFREDATFCVIPGLARSLPAEQERAPKFPDLAARLITLESVNYAGHYIRHRNWELWLDKSDGSQLFIKDATFDMREPMWER